MLIVLLVVLSLILVSASVKIGCQQDSDCLIFGLEGASCINSVCTIEEAKQDISVRDDFRMKNGEVNWRVLSVDESKLDVCRQTGCINFSPEGKKYPLEALFDWLMYA